MEIRDAIPNDASAICEVMRRSISELCAADHRDDPKILGAWLANKRPDIVSTWIGQPESSLLVAVEDEKILGVAGVTHDGEITLNYVAPDGRFRGVSRALLAAVEARAVERGNVRCRLISTETAHRFYLARGYEDIGPPQGKFGTQSSYPMGKMVAR